MKKKRTHLLERLLSVLVLKSVYGIGAWMGYFIVLSGIWLSLCGKLDKGMVGLLLGCVLILYSKWLENMHEKEQNELEKDLGYDKKKYDKNKNTDKEG